ncbi:MAG: ECF transporter S component [Acetatifactor sp.]
MNTIKKDTRWMVSVALMAAIVVLLANTPLGMIQLPIIKATTVHIPVIIGAILLGPAAGAILGATFGICSLIINTMAPTLLSFAFSPFLSTTGLVGAVKAIWISVGCRTMIGVVAGWLWILFKKIKLNSYVALAITGFMGSMVNTVLVMGSIYVLLAKQYAQAREVGKSAVFGLIMGTVTATGIPEAIAAAILVVALGKVLLRVFGTIWNRTDKQTA